MIVFLFSGKCSRICGTETEGVQRSWCGLFRWYHSELLHILYCTIQIHIRFETQEKLSSVTPSMYKILLHCYLRIYSLLSTDWRFLFKMVCHLSKPRSYNHLCCLLILISFSLLDQSTSPGTIYWNHAISWNRSGTLIMILFNP